MLSTSAIAPSTAALLPVGDSIRTRSRTAALSHPASASTTDRNALSSIRESTAAHNAEPTHEVLSVVEMAQERWFTGM